MPENLKHRVEILRANHSLIAPAGNRYLTVRDALVGLADPRTKNNIPNHEFRDGARPYPGHTGSALDKPSKALKAGAHKGGLGLDAEPGQALYKRLGDHAKSIAEATNLKSEDFFCRFLAVDDIWIPLAESLLIEKFAPL